MIHKPPGQLVVMAFLLAAPLAGGPLQAQPGFTEQQVDQAIERGIQSLFNLQKADGSWGDVGRPGDYHYYVSGHDVCAMMGLAYGEVSINNDRLQKGLNEPVRNTMTAAGAASLFIIVPEYGK
ncbi:MAG: hypothetical protein GWP05_02105 [Anaerolineaceae bacterium]|nr:hypothetical protein [Anaerolineaceae bacterium]